jgi:transposase
MVTSTLATASAAEQPATIAVAVELSRARWVVAARSPLADKISLHQLEGGDSEGLLALIARLRARVARALARPVAVVSCYEAGYDGFWLRRLLVAQGVHNHVIDPASLQVNRRARRVKTDRIDAERLLRALLAHRRGEPKVISVVRVPSVAEEACLAPSADLRWSARSGKRRLHRERHRLVRERVQHVNRIQGLCATQGICDFQPLRQGRQERLQDLRTGDGRALPPRLAAELARELQRLAPRSAPTSGGRRWEPGEGAGAARRARGRARRHRRGARAGAPACRQDQDLDQAQRHRAGVRDRAGRRGLPPPFRQPARGRERCRPGALPVPERRPGARAGHRQGRQRQGAHHDGRARLAVAAPPAGQRAQPMVPAAGRGAPRAGAPDRRQPWATAHGAA